MRHVLPCLQATGRAAQLLDRCKNLDDFELLGVWVEKFGESETQEVSRYVCDSPCMPLFQVHLIDDPVHHPKHFQLSM